MRADMHSHSSASDGTDPPATVIARARAASLDVIALTDHDTVAGHAAAAAALPPGLTLLPGMELSCRRDGHSVHMLAYLFDPANAELAQEMAAIRDSRDDRAQAMLAKLAELGAPVTWDQVLALADGGVVGRPHIARALAASGVVATPQEAFTRDWIAPGGRAHVTRYAPDPLRAVGLVQAAGGVSVLAHPRAPGKSWIIPDEVIASLAHAGLTGVEVCHPQQDAGQRRQLAGLAAELGLIATGGSDDHGSLTGYRLGCETTGADVYERLTSMADGAQPVTAGGTSGGTAGDAAPRAAGAG